MNTSPRARELDYSDIAELLFSIGWKSPNDAQWYQLRDSLPTLREMCAAILSTAATETGYTVARDAILNERGPLEGEGLTGDQINAVLAVLDDAFATAAEPPTEGTPYDPLCGCGGELHMQCSEQFRPNAEERPRNISGNFDEWRAATEERRAVAWIDPKDLAEITKVPPGGFVVSCITTSSRKHGALTVPIYTDPVNIGHPNKNSPPTR